MALGSGLPQDSHISLYVGLLWLHLGHFMIDDYNLNGNDRAYFERAGQDMEASLWLI